jgi:SepF-like predicted cell division protein (DUF552 family)
VVVEEEAEEEEERKTEVSVAECSKYTDASTYSHTLSQTASILIPTDIPAASKWTTSVEECEECEERTESTDTSINTNTYTHSPG